ncbi:MAG: hypothetical protein ACHQ5A_08755 [Opitutales bacterium]
MASRGRGKILLGCLLLILSVTARLPAAEDPWIHGVYTGRSPRPVELSERDAWLRASECAGRNHGAFVLVGCGESMQPLYPPGTILVLQTVPYARLQPGQTVLYRNRENRTVAHVLVARTRDGWRITGLNNPTHDMEPVHAGNLVGVVIAAFLPRAVLLVQR